MKNATQELKFAPVYEMARTFEAWCKENNYEIEDRERACGGSMYYEVRHISGIGVSQSIRISNHPHKYNSPDYSVGDDSFEGLFVYLQNELEERATTCLSRQIASFVANIAA